MDPGSTGQQRADGSLKHLPAGKPFPDRHGCTPPRCETAAAFPSKWRLVKASSWNSATRTER
jgi:hypothetical protein